MPVMGASGPIGFDFNPNQQFTPSAGYSAGAQAAGGGGGGYTVPGPPVQKGSGSGGFPNQMMMGSPVAMMQGANAAAMGPMWKQQMMQPHIGEAYNLANQMVGPGFGMAAGMQSPTPWGNMLQQMMSSRMNSQHPGMGTAEWTQGLQNISGAAEGEKAKAMSLLGSTGGGTVDPRAASAALSRIQGGVPSAVANLAAKRSGLDLQALMGMGGLQAPLARQELVNQAQLQQSYGSEVRGLAGRFLQGGTYGGGGFAHPTQNQYKGTVAGSWI